MSGTGLRHRLAALTHRLRVRRDRWRDRTLWALDLETGGLDPARDPILSVGMVPIRDGAVALGDAYHSLVRPGTTPSVSSLAIHHILPDELRVAPEPAEVLEAVRERVEGGVVVVHQRSMDIPFLRSAYGAAGRPMPVFAVIDTVDLLLRYARRHGHATPERPAFPTGLAPAREWFGLPGHRAHDALSGAITTAELFLVLAHRLPATRVGALI